MGTEHIQSLDFHATIERMISVLYSMKKMFQGMALKEFRLRWKIYLRMDCTWTRGYQYLACEEYGNANIFISE